MLTPLLQLAKKLRQECPWDKELTLEKIPPMLIEEAQELLQEIKKEDWPAMKAEVGDVLFNLLMLITIAEEKGHFTAEEVVAACEEKIISRHTWVFGGDKATTPEEALALWKENKKKEKA
ncbi:MAG: MazG nucleotide pyrophosphohydrolase domain-containing protein [Candidatus Altimarinota bacterium]